MLKIDKDFNSKIIVFLLAMNESVMPVSIKIAHVKTKTVSSFVNVRMLCELSYVKWNSN